MILKRRNSWKLAFFTVVLVCSAAMPVGAQSKAAGALIDRIIAAYGGRRQVLAVRGYRLEASLHAVARGETAPFIGIVEGPARLKIYLGYRSAAEVRVLDRENAWRGESVHKLTPVQGPLRQAMVLQAARANLPWILEQWKSRVRLAGPEGGTTVLDLSVGKGMELRVFVDEKTHRITKSESVMTMEGRKMVFETDYTDFRKVHGVLFAFHEENYADRVHTASTTVKSIQLNPTGKKLELPASP